MPDFERLTRSLQIHVAKTKEEKAIVKAYHAGQDNARKQILYVFCFVSILYVLVSLLLNF